MGSVFNDAHHGDDDFDEGLDDGLDNDFADGPDEAPETDDPFVSAAWRAEQVRAMERPLLERGVPLMRMAATAAAHVAQAMLERQPDGPDVADAHVLLLAGAGDNGGDGLFAAAELADQGANVVCAATGRTLHAEGLRALLDAGGRVLALDPEADIPGAAVPDAQDGTDETDGDPLERVMDLYENADLVIDAMTGIGLKGALRGIPAQLAERIGADRIDPRSPALPVSEPAAQYPMVLAVDVPSGVGVDDGTLPGTYIPADVTVSFGALKPCALLPPAAYACGQVVLVDFGFDTSRVPVAVELVSAAETRRHIRLPRLADNKYARGVVGLITGSDAYPGAAVLSASAAARANAGMVRYLGPERAERMVLDRLPEAVFGEGRCQAWVVGSGIPDGDHADVDSPQREAIRRLLEPYAVGEANWPEPESLLNIGLDDLPESFEDLMAMLAPTYEGGQESLPPVVVDAGALDLLPERVPPQVVITPHAGELARLLRSRGQAVDADDVERDPLGCALEAWRLTGATVLLKGAITVVVGSDGPDKPRVVVNGNAPAWLSTAGSGDVLAGSLGALLAQAAADEDRSLTLKMADLAAAGAFIHGLAGQLASGSGQAARPPVVVYDEDRDRLAEAMAPTSEKLRDATPFAPIGKPILAGDVIAQLPNVYALFASMNLSEWN
ncbi:bifunctional ADP-dependent NAD(P)H-hydrate dehydratase/NAD(P)H-hydrate epimerase [Bifidobacterium avesanii]|uniref:Multifunctional fusion protein n=1 Tax=Bifidobacterium avesanii TaxID=1798157 RepID=A0A7K3TG25_9BIFI|nr:bifunctional ADP-dependent NAD(P)H-hydrate dehydratase/NAD(P)H-hydrate epimerase [Bifidobacterium avesanii]KAB8291495.1 carbohydrate kinase [Bifidobacterium avesanii]NEG77876.1 bifunctional ADP-dependent NAD(P)H-hydrate dehydratase/NAD(P)H-hydrate epimerase [Bifidobacterium avesanii]